MILFETYPSGSLNCRERPPGGITTVSFARHSNTTQDVPRKLMVLDSLPEQTTIYNDLHHPVQLLPKWDLRTLASSWMEESFWESRFSAFQSGLLILHVDLFSSTSLVSAQSTRSLTERRITHIVSVCTEPIPAHHPQSGIRYLRVPVEDQPYEDLLIWMPHTCRFIDEALRTGGVVLVHGVHGLSRGATIMAAYCMIPVPPCLIRRYPNSLAPLHQ